MIAPPPAVNFIKKEPRQVGLKHFLYKINIGFEGTCPDGLVSKITTLLPRAISWQTCKVLVKMAKTRLSKQP